MAFVLDASVALAWAIPDEFSEPTNLLLRRCQASFVEVPALWPTELANGLLVAERRLRLLPQEIVEFLSRLEALDVRIQPSTVSQQAVAIEIARKEQLTVYDASYLALALRAGMPLATQDAALIRAAARCGVPVL